MAVTNQTPRNVSTATAGATVFPYSFKIIDKGDILVTVDDVEKTVDVDYTVSGVGNDAGGDVTLLAPLEGGETVVRLRNMTFERSTDYQNLGDLRSATLNNDQDAPVLMVQQLAESVSRGLRIPAALADTVSPDLPAPSALSALVWSADGTSLENGDTSITGDMLLRPNLADADVGGASLVAVKRPGTGAVSRLLSAKIGDLPLTPADFGAVGDGTADDTAAIGAVITRALATGEVVDFGDDTRQYRVTAKIQHTVGASGLRIKSAGATITYDPAAETREAMLLQTSGYGVELSGKLTIDANDKARIGILVQNDTTGGSVIADGLSVRNVRRTNTTFSGGDGILVEGPFDRVILNNPDVRNCRMAAGAGVLGSQGIFGITVTRSNSTGLAPRYVSITDPYIDGVFSEDDTYEGDQDAIRVFGSTPGVDPTPNFFEVRGGYLAQHYGRGIKGQFNFGRISGTKFHRTTGYASGLAGREIDFQYGGGTVRDIECLYDGDVAPECIVQAADPTVSGGNSPGVTVDGVKVINLSAVAIPYAFVQAVDQPDRAVLDISNVEIRGPLTRLVQWWVLSASSVASLLTLSDVKAAPTTDWINARTSTSGDTGYSKIIARGCVNTGGSDIAFVRRSTTGSVFCEVSAVDCYGFTDAPSNLSSGEVAAPFLRVHGIGAANVRDSGIFRPVSNLSLANNGEWVLPQTTRNGQSCIIIVTVGSPLVGDQAVFAMSTAGAQKVTASGANWTVGATTDPGSGNWRIWTAAGGITIKNASGTARSVMAYIFG